MIPLLAASASARAPAEVGDSLTGVGTVFFVTGPAVMAGAAPFVRDDLKWPSDVVACGAIATAFGALAITVAPLERAQALQDLGYVVDPGLGRRAPLLLGIGLGVGAAATTVAVTADVPEVMVAGIGLGGAAVLSGVVLGWVQGDRNRRALAAGPVELTLLPTSRGLALAGRF